MAFNKKEYSKISIDNITDIGKVLSFIISLLIILSLLKSTLYYSAFGIIITDYLDFSEALLLFFRDISSFFIVTIYFGAYFFILPSIVPENYKSGPFNLWLFILFFFIMTIYLLDLIFIYFFNASILITILISLFIVVSLLLLFYLAKQSRKYSSLIINTNVQNIIIVFLLPSFLAALGAHSKLEKIITLHKTDKVSLKLYNKSSLSVSKDTLYLGRTKSKIFLYDVNQSSSIIINSSDVEQIIIIK
jgi:hypothetical protein